MTTVEEALAETRKNARICPMPTRWNQLYKILIRSKRDDEPRPKAPLILAAWYAPGVCKIMRLQEHIDWAEEHGCLEEVDSFLKALPEDDWYHGSYGR